jgi:cytochrome c peroxidase
MMRNSILAFLGVTGSLLHAQRPNPGPPPVPVFSPDLIKSFTPANNPITDAKAKLGDMLFDDKRLSVDDTVACNTCHSPRTGFTAHIETAKGVRDQLGKRNAPTLLNAMFFDNQFWDGRAATLEEQATLPILNPIEMGQKDPQDVVKKLSAIPEFVEAFKQVFDHPVNWEDMRLAIAAFERTRLSTEAPIDRFLKGQKDALTASQQRGWALYNGKAHCNGCHGYDPALPVFGDKRFHNTGAAARRQDFTQLAARAEKAVATGNLTEIDRLALETESSELGRFLVTKNRADIGAFKTPFLRDVLLTAPYMHDGSLPTLWDVIDHFNRGGEPNPFLDSGVQRLGLTEKEIDDLVDLLGAFTSDRYAAQGDEEMQRQRSVSRKAK